MLQKVKINPHELSGLVQRQGRLLWWLDWI